MIQLYTYVHNLSHSCIFNFKGSLPSRYLFYFLFSFSYVNISSIIWLLKILKTWHGSNCFCDINGRKERNRGPHALEWRLLLFFLFELLYPVSPEPLVCFTVLLSMLPPWLPLAPAPQSSLWLWSAGRDLRAVDCGTWKVKGVLEFNLVDFAWFTDQQTEPEGGKPSSSQKKEPEFCIFWFPAE